MGGADKVARQHQFGKLTIRERIARLVDAGTFHEIGTLAGVGEYDEDGKLREFTPSNFVFGTASIDGGPVIVSGDDFTVRGGSADASIAGKRVKARRSRARAAAAAHPSGRRHGRRRFGQDDRDRGPHLHPRGARLGNGGRAPRGGAVGVARVGIGRRHRRRARRHQPLLADRARHRADDDRRSRAGGVRRRRRRREGRARATPASTPPTARSTTRSSSEDEAFERARRFLSYLPTSVNELPPRATAERRSEPARRAARLDRAERSAQGLQDAPRSSKRWSIAAGSSRSAATGASRSSPGSPASTAGRSRCSPRTSTSTAADGPPTRAAS